MIIFKKHLHFLVCYAILYQAFFAAGIPVGFNAGESQDIKADGPLSTPFGMNI